MNKLIILRGPAASGKTTWANEQMRQKPGAYRLLHKVDDFRIIEALCWGIDVILDTNMNDTERAKINDRFKDEAIVETKTFPL